MIRGLWVITTTPKASSAGRQIVEVRETVTDPAERGAMGGRGNKAHDNCNELCRGTSADYWASRLKRDA